MGEIEDLRAEIERLHEEATGGILENVEIENKLNQAARRNSELRAEVLRLREVLGDVCKTAKAALEGGP